MLGTGGWAASCPGAARFRWSEDGGSLLLRGRDRRRPQTAIAIGRSRAPRDRRHPTLPRRDWRRWLPLFDKVIELTCGYVVLELLVP